MSPEVPPTGAAPPSRGGMFGKILVGFDGSQPARRALEAATEIAGKFGASLTVAIVRPETEDAPSPDLERLFPLGDDPRPLGVILDEARDRALAKGARSIDSTVLRGDVVDLLVSLLERERYELAVVGSRGVSAGRRIFLGSVSSALVDRAPCPVLVIRPAKRSAGSRSAASAPKGA
jgi:nucleotide-binding universal stress UspA family protein